MSARPRPIHAPFANRRFDWTWISLGLYLALVTWWLRLALEAASEVVLPYFAFHYIPSALIFAGGLAAYAVARTTWQKALALQAGLLLSPGTGDLVAWVFWSTLFEPMHGQPVPALAQLAVFAGFGLPWLLLMLAPGLVPWLGRALGLLPPGLDAAASQANAPGQDWGLGLRWALASALAWLVMLWVAILGPLSAIFWPALAVLPGALQWLVLRRRVLQAGWWVVATAAGVLIGSYLAASREMLDLYVARRDALDSLLAYSTFGTALSLAQWMVLKRWSVQAHRWIVANMLAWPTGWAVATVLGAVLGWPWLAGIEPVMVGCVAGLLTGVALASLLPVTRRADGSS